MAVLTDAITSAIPTQSNKNRQTPINMTDQELTPANYIQRIKSMTGADRRAITAKKLIELIVATPTPDERQAHIDAQLAQLQDSLHLVSTIAAANKEEITTLRRENTEMSREIQDLKENGANAENEANLTKEIEELRSQVNEIDQYLRVNNLEFVGLPPPNQGETEETVIINACNSLTGLSVVVRAKQATRWQTSAYCKIC